MLTFPLTHSSSFPKPTPNLGAEPLHALPKEPSREEAITFAIDRANQWLQAHKGALHSATEGGLEIKDNFASLIMLENGVNRYDVMIPAMHYSRHYIRSRLP
jgi:hypothetical protein